MKRFMVSAIAVLLIILAADVSFAAEKAWKLGHVRPKGSAVDIALKKFAQEVKTRTDGRITLDIFPASQLGDYTTVQERVAIGDVEMQCAPISPAVIKKLALSSFPYLVTNWEEAAIAFGPEGVVVQKMNEYVQLQDLHIIGSWPVYFGGILLTKEPPSPKDVNVAKGIKIRVPPVRAFEMTAESLGYLATPIPWADTFTSMQTGIVEGAIGSGAEGCYASFRDLAKYYLALNDHFECWFLYTNTELWNKISEGDRKILDDVARELLVERWKVAEKEEQDNEKKLADIGVQVIKFTPEELASIRDKISKEVWSKMYDEILEDDVKAVVESLKK